MKKIILSCLTVFAIASCVPQKQHQELENSYYKALDDQSNTSKDLTLANLKIETLEKDLAKAKSELYIKDTALTNALNLNKITQKEHDSNLQELYSALNSSGEKSKLFYTQLNEKEKQVTDLTQKVKDLEAKIDAKDTEIFNLKRQILTQEINQKVSEATATPAKTATKTTTPAKTTATKK
jgi:DNA repair exonuclease SbcCD ATPase subunit